MDKIIISILLFSSCSLVLGQNTFPSSGNVGIGTTSPTSKLSIKNAGGIDGVKLLELSEASSEEFLFKGYFLGTGAAGNKLILGTGVGGWQPHIMSWRGDGNVGIGTLSATSKLSIRNVGATDGVKLLDFSEGEAESFLFKGNFLGTGAAGNSVIIGSNVSGYQPNIMTWRGDGNVGIGVTSPLVKLHLVHDQGEVLRVESSASSSQVQLKSTGVGGINWSIMSTANSASLGGGKFSIYGNANHRFVIDQNGFTGIGVASPLEKLHVESGALQFRNIGPDQDNVDIIKIGENNTVNEFTLQGMFLGTGEAGNAIKFRSMWNDNLLTIKGNGQIGMGTLSTGTHKLAVEGTIGAREIKVEATGWSDFVFEKDYELLTLEEVEQHINENGHLPEIPSEKEVTENGINLGEMDAKLLQKIEELTLYMIDMNKRMNELETENQELKEKVKSLEN